MSPIINPTYSNREKGSLMVGKDENCATIQYNQNKLVMFVTRYSSTAGEDRHQLCFDATRKQQLLQQFLKRYIR